jgi:hypothetical protein
MERSFLAITLTLLLNIAGDLKGQEPRLYYALQAGESFMLEIDLQQSTRSESMEREEISFYTQTRMVFSVDSADADRNYHLSVRYNDLMISMLAPQLDMDISSGSGKNPLLSRMVDQLEQQSFHLIMSPAGELRALKGLDALFRSLESQPGADSLELEVILNTLNEAYGPDAFSSLFNVFLWIYPVISPMNNWTNDITYYFNTKPVTMVNRYNLSKSTEDMLVIQGLGMLNAGREFLETTSMGEVKSTVSGSQTYDFQVERKTGWPLRCVSRQRVLIETTILKSDYFPTGLKIPSYTETVFEVRGSSL